MKFGSTVRRRMLEGAFLSAADYLTAQRARSVLNEQIRANFKRVDVFAVPTAPRPPDTFEGMDPNEQNLRPSFTNPFNLTGLPAISVPCGFTDRTICQPDYRSRPRLSRNPLRYESPMLTNRRLLGMNEDRRFDRTTPTRFKL